MLGCSSAAFHYEGDMCLPGPHPHTTHPQIFLLEASAYPYRKSRTPPWGSGGGDDDGESEATNTKTCRFEASTSHVFD